MVFSGGQGSYHRIGKLFPSMSLVACRLMCPHREGGVEQQHALRGPARKVAVCRHGSAEVELYLLEDVYQRGWGCDAVAHRERQSVCLSRLVVGVLPYYHHLHPVERAQVEGVEDEASRRIARVGGVFGPHEIGEFGEIRLFKFAAYLLQPRRFYLYFHCSEGFRLYAIGSCHILLTECILTQTGHYISYQYRLSVHTATASAKAWQAM